MRKSVRDHFPLLKACFGYDMEKDLGIAFRLATLNVHGWQDGDDIDNTQRVINLVNVSSRRCFVRFNVGSFLQIPSETRSGHLVSTGDLQRGPGRILTKKCS